MKASALLFVLLFLLLAGCQTLSEIANQCDKSVRAYNRMIRWQDYDPAEKAVEEKMRAEFKRRLSAKELRIVDYRIKSLSCNPEKGEAEAIVEYDYYLTPSTALKTVEDVQKWRYSPDVEPGGWRVVTPPPEFKK